MTGIPQRKRRPDPDEETIDRELAELIADANPDLEAIHLYTPMPALLLRGGLALRGLLSNPERTRRLVIYGTAGITLAAMIGDAFGEDPPCDLPPRQPVLADPAPDREVIEKRPVSAQPTLKAKAKATTAPTADAAPIAGEIAGSGTADPIVAPAGRHRAAATADRQILTAGLGGGRATASVGPIAIDIAISAPADADPAGYVLVDVLGTPDSRHAEPEAAPRARVALALLGVRIEIGTTDVSAPQAAATESSVSVTQDNA